ncbi:MAG: hypothetical protein ABR969_04050, partial [Sedimentisphaerales bacterium]
MDEDGSHFVPFPASAVAGVGGHRTSFCSLTTNVRVNILLPMPKQVKKTLLLSIYFALTVSALLVFWQVRNFDFINYDDNYYVYENPHVLNGLTFDNIIWAFTTGHASNWHPLTWLSLMLDCQLSLPGGPNPGRIHLINLLLHIANTLLL